MSCHSCASNFGVFKKEHGCPSCGFSFCVNCLKYKDNKGKKGICRTCSELDNKKEMSETRPPPDIFLKRLETLEDPTRPPVTVYTQNPDSTLQNFQNIPSASGGAPSDQELRGRLQNLRKRLVHAPSVEEIEERLSRLQGLPLKSKSNSIDVAALKPKSNEEDTQNLMKQYMEETKLNKNIEGNLEKEIEERLARLKGIPEQTKEEEEQMDVELSQTDKLIKTLTGKTSSELPSEETELEIVNRYLAEVALDEKLEDDDDDFSVEELVSEEQEDQLPWCCICNEDATLRCPGCMGDLYCSQCFKTGHDVSELNEHKPTPYEAKVPAELS